MNVKHCHIVNIKCVDHNFFSEIVALTSMFSREFNKLRVELMVCFTAWDGMVEIIQIIFLLLKKREIHLLSVSMIVINHIPEL